MATGLPRPEELLAVILGRKLLLADKTPKMKGGEENLNRTQKENVIAELATCFKESRAVFVTDFKGLTVEQMTA